MSCTEIIPHNMKTYQVNHGHEWAVIHVMWRFNKDGGMNLLLMIHSSYGSWTYNWTHCGKTTMEEWLTGLNMDYMMNKLMGPDFMVDLTTSEALTLMIERLKAEELTSLQRKLLEGQEKRFWEEHQEDLHEMDLFEAVKAWDEDALSNCLTLPDDYTDWETHKVNPTAALFFDGLWEEFRKHLKGD